MSRLEPLSLRRLYTPCDPRALGFRTTREVEEVGVFTGQDRALEAIRFGIAIERAGFNVFALGRPGTGKLSAVREIVGRRAAEMPTPSDWCYVERFDDPQKPAALRLPAGYGARLRRDMEQLVDDLAAAIPAAFDNEDTRGRLEEVEEEFRERRAKALEEVREEGSRHGVAVLETPVGFTFAPLAEDGEVMRPEAFQNLSEEEKQRIKSVVEELQDRVQKMLRQLQVARREMRERTRALQREIARFAVGSFIDALRERYVDLPGVVAYLDGVQEDVVEHAHEFLRSHEPGEEQAPLAEPSAHQRPALQRYAVNVLVDNSAGDGAPVVHESFPTYTNLVGRTEHIAHMGTLTTNFTLIRPGALHRANGGYLVLDARKLLGQPFAWEALKRALDTGEIRIESVERALSLMSTMSLEPEPVPLDVKVILFGERLLYYLLGEYDPEFRDLFKVAADFDDAIDRDPEDDAAYARLVATVARRGELKPMDARAVARTVEHASRLAGDAGKASLHLRSIGDLLAEADHAAAARGADTIGAADVQGAIDAGERRAGRLRERIHEQIGHGTLLIDTAGRAVGQVNALAVLLLDEHAFAHPVRVTATARLGGGGVVDIERKAELGGPIHSKGVLILSSFLMARYGARHPVSLTASLVFEQSYAGVEGDSASLAELCALLSAAGDIPLDQSIALTGSVNQLGRVQAIGGVNEKVEGFFDLCAARGFTGRQGVIIPAANVRHLMLHERVRDAVRERRFAVWAVETMDEAIELLSGLPAGEPDAEGRYPDGSVNARVGARLRELAEIHRAYARPPSEDRAPETDGAAGGDG